MAFQTVWSVDVGKSSLKAVKVHRERNSLEILAVDKVNYAVDTGGVNSLQQAKEALETFASRNEINCPVVASHPGHSAFSRFIQLPPVDEKKLEEMVGYEAQQQIPFPIDEVVWDYHICDDNSAGSPEKEVGIFAVRKEVVSDFMVDYESAGLPVDMISIGYLGLLNYVVFDLRPQKPSVVIDIGSDHTDLLVVDGSRFWVRNLAIAGNDITQTLMDKFKLQFDEAEKLKINASKSDQAVKIFGVVQPILKELVNEIHRSVGFYKSQAGDVKFEDVYLFGNTARLLGIQKYLQEQLRFRVHVAKGFSRIRVNRESNVALLQQDFPAFASAVGNAIQGLGSGEADVNLMPKEQQAAIEFRRKQKMVLVAAACLFIVPIFWFMVYSKKSNNAQTALEQTKITTTLNKHKKSIADFGEAKVQALDEEFIELQRATAYRSLPADGLAMINDVFSRLPNADFEAGKASEPEASAKRGELEAAQETLNESKHWLVNYSVELVSRNQDGSVDEIEKDKRSFSDPKSCVAYRFTIVGMAYAKPAGDQENFAQMKQQIQDPLEALLRDRFGEPPFDADAWVQGETVAANDDGKLFMQHPNFLEKRGGGGNNREQFEMGTFYPFKLVFLLQDKESLPQGDAEEPEE